MVDAFHRGKLAADDALLCLPHPLEGFAISRGAAAEPGSDAAREDAFSGAPVEVVRVVRGCWPGTMMPSP